MSRDYYYYLAYRTKDNKIIPFDLKTLDGRYRPIYHHCSSNDPIYEYFKDFRPTDDIDPTFERQMIPDEDEDWVGYHSNGIAWTYPELLTDELPIKSGYFLIDDVLEYQTNKYYTDGMFESMISPEVYAQLVSRQLEFGYIEEENYYSKNASDYMYFSAVDYECHDYVGYHLRIIADRLHDYDDKEDGREVIIVGNKC